MYALGYHRDHSTEVKGDKDGWAEKGQVSKGREKQSEPLGFYPVDSWESIMVSMARAETWSTFTIS